MWYRTFLCRRSIVEDLDGAADVEVEEGHGGGSLPLSLLLQRPEKRLDVDVRSTADPAAQLQSQAALLAVVLRHICRPLRALPAAPQLCSA